MKRRTRYYLFGVGAVLVCLVGLLFFSRLFSADHRAYMLYMAALRGDSTKIKVLVWLGVDVNSATGSGAALHGAAYTGRTDIMEFLLQHGAQVDLPVKFGVTPLYVAREAHQSAAERLLLANGANPDTSHINPP
jgi:ankyrin repeat protein